MANFHSAYFYCLGRFVNFVPGEKSPCQSLLLEVMCSDCDLPWGETELTLSKALRQMMYGYLSPGDWVHVVGSGKLDSGSDQRLWQAREIVKLSATQAEARIQDHAAQLLSKSQLFTEQPIAEQPIVSRSVAATSKPIRILICQKSACLQRGALAVSEAVETALSEANCAQQVTIKAVGCLKQCKAGPNLVVLPGGDRYSQMTPNAARSLIQKHLQTAPSLL